MRTVILVGDNEDHRTEETRRFWQNFCWRVHHALRVEGLDCRVIQADKGVMLEAGEHTK